MTDSTIHNLTYFLTELDKNLAQLDELLEQEYIALQKIHIIHNTMHKMYQNWQLKDKFQK